ncbi:MAG: phospholipase D-like domain-containing protein, partial [Bacteroidales bacterium]
MKKLLPFSLFCILSFFSLSLNAQLFEDFEQGEKSSYAAASVSLSTGEWLFSDALVGTLDSDRKNGAKSARIRAGHVEMSFDHPGGFIEVSFYAGNFSNDTGGSILVSYSSDGGQSWTPLADAIPLTSTLEQYTLSGSVEGNVRLRFARAAGNRINLDDISITDYIQPSEDPTVLLTINDLPVAPEGTFDFGTTTGTASASLQIRNTGQQQLVVSSFAFSNDVFSISDDTGVTLDYLQIATLTLSYNEQTPGVKTATLTLQSNDPVNGTFVINLAAETLDTSSPIPIAEARSLPQGTLVTVTGWVTAASQFAGPVYFQDETAGMAWYSDPIMREEWLVGANIGDSIVVTGTLGNFNNLLQIVDHTSFEVFAEANFIPEPAEITIEQLNSGEYEASLVSITDVEFVETGIFSGGTNYTITDLSGQGQLRVDNFTNVPGTNIPNSLTQVTGIAGRFSNTHQLLVRFTDDIVILAGPIIVSAAPYEVSATASSITFEWETEVAGHSEVRYGSTASLELGNELDEEHKTSHQITLTGLMPATAYRVQLRSAFDADTSATSIYIASTASPEGTTGEILTFFNKSVNHEVATYREADQNINFANKLIEYIQQAEETAEFAFYSISGSVGTQVVDEIINAHNRGVDVRVIATGHTGTINENITRLAGAGVRAVQSLGVEQMHNKFAVIDAHHQDPSKSWIVTSSWNATDQGTNSQFQNMVIIQDVALARAYWYEFNQMWGGESGAFNESGAHFGPDKTVVNPSVFWVGNDQTQVEVYFSPQANTEAHINRTLTSAQENIDLVLNLITRRPISNTMLNRHNQGVKVRGAIGVISGLGNEFEYLSSWADVHHFSEAEFGLLHHKYAIVDGEQAGDNAKVITGSHNWSANANYHNDENTLIIHNSRVANEYFQEFAARYQQAGGQDVFDVPVSVNEPVDLQADDQLFMRNFPNPFQGTTNIQFRLDAGQQVVLNVYDMMGRKMVSLLGGERLDQGVHT